MGRRYTGILNDPIEFPSIVEVEPLGRLAGDLEERWDALFALHQIDPASPEVWQKIAMALARDHVPGFSAKWYGSHTDPRNTQERRGRPPKSDDAVIPLSAFVVLARRVLPSERKIAALVAKHQLVPGIGSEAVRKLIGSDECKALQMLANGCHRQFGLKFLCDGFFLSQERFGTAAPGAEWIKVLGNELDI